MKKLIPVLIVMMVAALGVGLGWLLTSEQPTEKALAALESTELVEVNEGDLISFRPTSFRPDTGLIFYPGARIDPRAYATLAQKIAKEGFLVVLVPMPSNLAIFGSVKADTVRESFPEIRNWGIAGHSLGGVMAARYADEHTEIKGLVLLAAAPGYGNDLSDNELEATSVYGTNDGLFSKQGFKNSQKLLPGNAVMIEIEGGNHSQFGDFGTLLLDGKASISVEDQHTATVARIVDLLFAISE